MSGNTYGVLQDYTEFLDLDVCHLVFICCPSGSEIRAQL